MEENKIINNFKESNLNNQKCLIPGILAVVVFTKKFYKSNEDLKKMTNLFSLNYKEYLFKSRTLLYSRLVKDLFINNENIDEIISKILSILNNDSHEKNRNSNKKKNSQSDIIDEWSKIINPHDD